MAGSEYVADRSIRNKGYVEGFVSPRLRETIRLTGGIFPDCQDYVMERTPLNPYRDIFGVASPDGSSEKNHHKWLMKKGRVSVRRPRARIQRHVVTDVV